MACRDEDGVLSFQELQLVMKSLGHRPPGQLLVSTDLKDFYIVAPVKVNLIL